MTAAEQAIQIKQLVSMGDVLARYGLEVNSKGFMKCPFHAGGNEKTPSFQLRKNNTFKCFGCDANGSVIDFVMRMEGCSFKQAIEKLDYSTLTFTEKRHLKECRRKIDEEKRKKLQNKNEYHALLDEWIRLDINKRKYKPLSLDEEPQPLFIEALQKLANQGYLLDCFTKEW